LKKAADAAAAAPPVVTNNNIDATFNVNYSLQQEANLAEEDSQPKTKARKTRGKEMAASAGSSSTSALPDTHLQGTMSDDDFTLDEAVVQPKAKARKPRGKEIVASGSASALPEEATPVAAKKSGRDRKKKVVVDE